MKGLRASHKLPHGETYKPEYQAFGDQWYTWRMRKHTATTLRRYLFSREDQDRLLEDTIREWQSLGVAAIWQATWELTVLSYALRGIDVRNQPMDRTRIEKRVAPWGTSRGGSRGDDFDSWE